MPAIVNITGFPIAQSVTLCYCAGMDIETDTAAIGYKDFRANGMYDPEVAIGGHQPLGFDQWSAFYNHWIVYSSTIEATFRDNAEANLCQVGILLGDDTTMPVTATAIREQPLNRNKFLVSGNVGKQAITTVRHTFNTKQFFNLVDVKDAGDRLGGSIAADPTDVAIFRVYFGLADDSTSSRTFNIAVKIRYTAVFSEPKALPQS